MNTTVRTEANLNSRVLREIVGRLGLPDTPYELNERLIDEQLLKARNEIAHGEYLNVDLAEFESIYSGVVAMLNAFATDILNAAALGDYRV
jgi:hypothetical protein